jgi:hypothetical protein
MRVRLSAGSGRVAAPAALVDRLRPDTAHLTIGSLSGRQILALLRPHERCNFVVQTSAEGGGKGAGASTGSGSRKGNSRDKSKSAVAVDPAVGTDTTTATDTVTDTHTAALAGAQTTTVPSCGRLVLSHVGSGQGGGLYAKHALLADLCPVSFAGKL